MFSGDWKKEHGQQRKVDAAASHKEDKSALLLRAKQERDKRQAEIKRQSAASRLQVIELSGRVHLLILTVFNNSTTRYGI